MEPNSLSLIVVLLCSAAGAIAITVRYRPLLVRIISGALAIALSAAAGVALVNDHYGYYQTWSQLSADLSGDYANFAATPVVSRKITAESRGALETVTLPGKDSGISRAGLVYLPPQYFERRYAHAKFPAVELLHGTPGSPSNWVVQLRIAGVANELISRHLMGPLILVMPTMSVGTAFQECVDGPGALDDTYLTQDVRTDMLTRYRVSTVAAEWGVAGYSSGGYCAANLALRHPGEFGASGIMDGYFRPQDGPAAAALHFDAAAEAANNPLLLATKLSRDVSPLPSFWIAAGTGNSADINGALAFSAALHGVEQVTLYREPHANHNFYAWLPAASHLLAWMWGELAPPELRVQFPIAGSVHQLTINAPLPPTHLTAGRTAVRNRPRKGHKALSASRRS